MWLQPLTMSQINFYHRSLIYKTNLRFSKLISKPKINCTSQRIMHAVHGEKSNYQYQMRAHLKLK